MGSKLVNVIADTHTWIWWVIRSDELSISAKSALDSADLVLIPAICLWEIGMLVEKRRVRFLADVREFFSVGLTPGRVEIAPITAAIAARSSEFGSTLHGDPADRLIGATAIELATPLVTRDARLTDLAGLRTIW